MKINRKADKWHPFQPFKGDASRMTRQRERALLRDAAFAEVTAQYGGEMRKHRRLIARNKAARDYRAAHGLAHPMAYDPPTNRAV